MMLGKLVVLAAVLNLSGEWEFRLDPLDAGVREKWYEPAVQFPHKIGVPGAWNAQGFGFDDPRELRKYLDAAQTQLLAGPGSETDRLFHVYPGPAWYRTAVRIPQAWKGKRLRLKFGGVHRTADIWVNGTLLGRHVGYVVPFEYDITPLVTPPQEITIVVRVDARRDPALDPLMGCMDTLDFLFVSWGGIHRGVELEAAEKLRTEDAFVIPRISEQAAELHLSWNGTARRARFIASVLDQAGNTVARKTLDPGGKSPVIVSLKLPHPEFWSPSRPYLYTARVELFDGEQRLDLREFHFGMREFKVENGKFLLNGRPFFVRGYGDDCIYPNTIAPPADRDEYRRRLRLAKDFGFNYVRHHSWIPTAEYLDTADEIGMLVQPEFPIAGPADLPKSPEGRELHLTLWQEVIRNNRNHPSIAVWSMGNEIWDSFDQAPEMYRLARLLDPTRPVIDSNGLHRPPLQAASVDGKAVDVAGPAAARHHATLDFWPWQFDESRSFGYKDGKYTFAATVRPVVAHEAGYFATLPDLRQLGLFQGGLKPFWLTEALELTRQKGVERAYEDWVDKSNRLQAVCLKTNIEAARRSNLQGYHVWLLQDYPWCAEGVVDMFFRPKAVSAAEFSNFNGPTVLLTPQDKRNYLFGQKVEFPIVVSRYEQEPSTTAVLHWELRLGDEILASGKSENLDVPCGEPRLLSTLSFPMPSLSRAQRLRLRVHLEDSQGVAANEWDLWAFPAERIRPGGFAVRGSAWLEAQFPASSGKAAAEPSAGGLLVTDRWEPRLQNFLEAGGRVLLLDPDPVFPAVKTRYRPSGWDPKDRSTHVGTTFDASHPAMQAMPSEGWCDLQFHDLIQGARLIRLDETPVTGEPIVRAIDIPQRLARNAYLFEARVGNGRLLASGFNFATAIPAGDPAAAYLLDGLIRYALSENFQPTGSIPLAHFQIPGVR
jgi:beta-galactosidase